jgi:drug/metabolite transporter (DMT)-like permease
LNSNTPRLDWRIALLMTVPPLLWAGNAVVGRYAADLISPLLLNLLRWLGAGLLLLPLGWRIVAAADSRQRIAAHWKYLAVLALFGVGAFNALQYTGLRTTTAINATLVLASGPVFTVLIGALFFGTPARRQDVLAAALSVTGVVLVLSGGQFETIAKFRFVPGDVYVLAATVGWSFYTWMMARPPATLRPPGSTPWNWAEFLMLQIVIGAVWAGLFAGTQAATAAQGLGQPQWGWPLAAVLVYVIVFPSLVAYRCWGLGVARAGPVLTTVFSNLNPLFAAVLSAVWLGEPPGWHHGLAFVMIVAGIWVSSRPSAAPAPQAAGRVKGG